VEQIPDAKGIQVTAIVWGLRLREMEIEVGAPGRAYLFGAHCCLYGW